MVYWKGKKLMNSHNRDGRPAEGNIRLNRPMAYLYILTRVLLAYLLKTTNRI